MRRTLACCLVAAQVAGPACMKTAYIVPAPAVGVEVPGPETVVVGRPATPKPQYQVAIKNRCIHWDTAKAVGTDGREVRAEVSASRNTKLVFGALLAAAGLPFLVSALLAQPHYGTREAMTIEDSQKAVDNFFGALLAYWVGGALEVGGAALLISGAVDRCPSPPHLPLPPAATATATATAG